MNIVIMILVKKKLNIPAPDPTGVLLELGEALALLLEVSDTVALLLVVVAGKEQ